MTPETETTTHYFMDFTRNFGIDGDEYPTDEDIYQEPISAFAELTEQLAQGADLKAAAAVADLIDNALD